MCITTHLYLPTPQHQTSSPYSTLGAETLVYMAFQPVRFIPPVCYHTATCALTAHFHPYLIVANKAVIFCDTCCTCLPSKRKQNKPHPLGGTVALCCSDFPHISFEIRDRIAHSLKVTNYNFQITISNFL